MYIYIVIMGLQYSSTGCTPNKDRRHDIYSLHDIYILITDNGVNVEICPLIDYMVFVPVIKVHLIDNDDVTIAWPLSEASGNEFIYLCLIV